MQAVVLDDEGGGGDREKEIECYDECSTLST